MFACQQEVHQTGGRANVYVCVVLHSIHRLTGPGFGCKVNQNILTPESSFAKIHIANITLKQLD